MYMTSRSSATGQARGTLVTAEFKTPLQCALDSCSAGGHVYADLFRPGVDRTGLEQLRPPCRRHVVETTQNQSRGGTSDQEVQVLFLRLCVQTSARTHASWGLLHVARMGASRLPRSTLLKHEYIAVLQLGVYSENLYLIISTCAKKILSFACANSVTISTCNAKIKTEDWSAAVWHIRVHLRLTN